jgi:hypothetical protein
MAATLRPTPGMETEPFLIVPNSPPNCRGKPVPPTTCAESNGTAQPCVSRSIEDGPWCWQSKAARRKIREAFDATHNVSTALAVYDALTEIASDEGANEFRTTHAWIELLSGFVGRTIRSVLPVLVEIKLLEIDSPILRAPCTYRLLPFGNGCRTFGNGAISPSLPRSEESQKKDQKKPCAGPASPSVASRKAAKRTQPRQRNLLIDALAVIDGSTLDQITPSAWSGIAKALKEIREVCPAVTPEEIRRRAANYRHQFRDVVISPHALAKHWSRCDRGPGGSVQAEPALIFIKP